ncbi:MAG TPA: phage capsid protein [Allosphingosinicella sp.]|jgi:hypothetical protein
MAVPGTPEAIEATRTVEYRLAVGFQLNEQVGKLKVLCGSSGSYSSKSAQIEDRFDDLQVREVTTRNGDTVNTDIDVERRFILKPRRQNVAPLIDPDDMMTTQIDLKSPIATQTAKAVRRAQDDRFLEGFFGTAYTGETGTTAVAFKAANVMATDYTTTGTDSGLTLNKLIGMQEMMESALVDLEAERPIIVYTAKQKSDLLKIAQVQSRDFNPLATQALQDGKVADFMGFRFVPAEIGNPRAYAKGSTLTLAAAGIRRLPVFVPSGMHWGTWEEFMGKISQRDDKNMSWQVYAETCGTATRTNEDKCFQILCKEG